MFKSLKHSLGKWKRNFFDERTYDDLIEDGWEMERVLGWTEKYCDSLMENYRLQYPDSSSDRKYEIKSGRKYHKVVASDLQTNGERWSQGVHAFVDKNTGEVYKPASWKSPAQYVRFDMRIINQREQLHNPRFTDWAGGHLYLR